jgi:hypothetical protein
MCATVSAAPEPGQPPVSSGPNLIYNGGFEEVALENVTTNNLQYKPLLDHGVAMVTGEKVPMPAMVYANPSDGWAGASNRFTYVEGKAGADVFAGTHAIRIESPTMSSAVGVGKMVSVAEGMSLDDRIVQVGVPCKLSFQAKGSGVVRVNCYMYNARGENLYDYAKHVAFAPGQFALTSDGQWHCYEGTVTIKTPEVYGFIFVIGARGDATLDEVSLCGQ